MSRRNDPCPCGSGKKAKKCCQAPIGRRWTAMQPRRGDRVVHCGHLDAPNWHWWKVVGLAFRRPDGTEGQADWICACVQCYEAAEKDPNKVQIRGDGIWQGNAPAVYENVNPEAN